MTEWNPTFPDFRFSPGGRLPRLPRHPVQAKGPTILKTHPAPAKVVQVVTAAQEGPVFLDSPHSGTDYPADFRYACDHRLLRRAEDTFVESLFSNGPAYGATLVHALFPRTYIDPNRSTDDI